MHEDFDDKHQAKKRRTSTDDAELIEFPAVRVKVIAGREYFVCAYKQEGFWRRRQHSKRVPWSDGGTETSLARKRIAQSVQNFFDENHNARRAGSGCLRV